MTKIAIFGCHLPFMNLLVDVIEKIYGWAKWLQRLVSPKLALRRVFNVMRWRYETTAISQASQSMINFNAFIDRCNLIDPPSPHKQFKNTWSNLRSQPTISRLDRLLYSKSWEIFFMPHYSRTLSKVTNHFSIVLKTTNLDGGPCPFRFSNVLLQNVTFKKNAKF